MVNDYQVFIFKWAYEFVSQKHVFAIAHNEERHVYGLVEAHGNLLLTGYETGLKKNIKMRYTK
ncbi:hypothetical protein JCM12294_42340 [Desulfocicer niacini]